MFFMIRFFLDVSSSEKSFFQSQGYISVFLGPRMFQTLFSFSIFIGVLTWAVPGLFAYLGSKAGFRASLSSSVFLQYERGGKYILCKLSFKDIQINERFMFSKN